MATEELKPKYLGQQTAKEILEDADVIPGKDMTAKKMVKISMLAVANYIVKKLKTLTFDTLKTTDKTLPGAINELNSKMDNLKTVSKTLASVSVAPGRTNLIFDISTTIPTGYKGINMGFVITNSGYILGHFTGVNTNRTEAYGVVHNILDSTSTVDITLALLVIPQ